LDNFIIGKREQRRGGQKRWPKKHIYAHRVYICSLFFGRQQQLPYITKKVVIVVVVVEASKTYQSSFDQELGA
jgi:hypothetical protein